MNASHPVERWHALVRSQDPTALADLLSESVVFHSPILHTPQRGRDLTTFYLTAAFHVLLNDRFKYVREVTSDDTAVLEFETEIDGIYINGVDLIRYDADGRITEFKVMVRPLKAMQTLHAKMAEMLTKLPKPA